MAAAPFTLFSLCYGKNGTCVNRAIDGTKRCQECTDPNDLKLLSEEQMKNKKEMEKIVKQEIVFDQMQSIADKFGIALECCGKKVGFGKKCDICHRYP
jgi:hypothetical protein